MDKQTISMQNGGIHPEDKHSRFFFVLLMLPIKVLYDNVTPPPLLLLLLLLLAFFLSLFSLRAGADAKECSNKELNICKHTMINTTHFTRRSAGDGRRDLEGNSSKTAPQIANS